MKKRSCDECLLIFRKLGFLTIEERLKTHKKHLHTIECQKCPRRFISRTHLQFHVESYHRTRCGDCLGFCGSQCTIYYAKRLELENEKMLDAGIIEKTEAAEAAGEELEEFIKKKVSLSSPLAQDMARLLDSGLEGPEALPWSRFVYLPTAKYPEIAFSPKVKEWIRLTILEMAFCDHKTRIENTNVNECTITKCKALVFNQWEHQWSSHPDSSSQHWSTETSIMKNASTTRGSNSGGKPREAKGDEDETEKIDMAQKAPATNNS